MQLKFHVKQRREGRFWEAIVYFEHSQDSDVEQCLTEDQYQKIARWCCETFHTDLPKNKYRARRMAYDAFWFKNREDLDWFIIAWSGINHQDI